MLVPNRQFFEIDSHLMIKAKHRRRDQHLLYRFNFELIDRKLITPGQHVLIAVSGGQDSVCVLNMLYRLSWNWNWKVSIVYCDHNWYPGSRMQGAHLSQLAASMRVDYYQAVSTQPLQNESMARDWRYELIQRVASRYQYVTVVTGHSASDRLETLIYNLLRGSGSNGLQSLSWKRKLKFKLRAFIRFDNRMDSIEPKAVRYRECRNGVQAESASTEFQLIRPLLSITRTELRYLMQRWGLPIWTDPTNQNLRVRRNRIRYQLLPYLRHYFNPRVDRILANWTEIVHAESMYLEALAHCIRSKSEDNGTQRDGLSSCATLDTRLLRVLPIAMQRRVLTQSLKLHSTIRQLHFETIEHIRIVSSLRSISLLANSNNRKLHTNTKRTEPCFGKYTLYLPGGTTLQICQQHIFILLLYKESCLARPY